MTREPGNLPSHWSHAGRGASATVEVLDCVGIGIRRFTPIPHPGLDAGAMRMGDSGPTGRATILVCITCRAAGRVDARAAETSGDGTPDEAVAADSMPCDASRAGLVLAQATAAAASNAADVSVQRVRCLGNCGRGLSAAIRCENAWTYVFGGLEASRDGSALIAGARLLAGAADGIMPWRGRPEPLKRGLIARIPPGNFLGELP